MKIQIDFDNKIIKLENNVNLKDFFDKVKNILSKDWEKFTLETNTTINNWSNPIIIKDSYPDYPTYPDYPHYPFITWQTEATSLCSSKDEQVTSGTYNFELN